MRRRLFNLLVVLSLLWAAAVLILWIRSAFRADQVWMLTGRTCWSFTSHNGISQIVILPGYLKSDLKVAGRPGERLAWQTWHNDRRGTRWDWWHMPAVGDVTLRWEVAASYAQVLGFDAWHGNWRVLRLRVLRLTSTGKLRVSFGPEFEFDVFLRNPTSGGPCFGMYIPCWMLIVPALPIPGVWLMLRYRRQRRARRGLCVNCGYDLRATPERCPECGMPASRKSPARRSRLFKPILTLSLLWIAAISTFWLLSSFRTDQIWVLVGRTCWSFTPNSTFAIVIFPRYIDDDLKAVGRPMERIARITPSNCSAITSADGMGLAGENDGTMLLWWSSISYVEAAGFGVWSGHGINQNDLRRRSPPLRPCYGVYIPAWMLIVPALPAPGVWLLLKYRQRRRVRRGILANCA